MGGVVGGIAGAAQGEVIPIKVAQLAVGQRIRVERSWTVDITALSTDILTGVRTATVTVRGGPMAGQSETITLPATDEQITQTGYAMYRQLPGVLPYSNWVETETQSTWSALAEPGTYLCLYEGEQTVWKRGGVARRWQLRTLVPYYPPT